MAYLSAHVVENGVEAYEYIEQLLSKPSLPSNLDEAAEEYANTHYGEFVEVEYEFGSPIETIVDDNRLCVTLSKPEQSGWRGSL